jgi:hypothetical protein
MFQTLSFQAITAKASPERLRGRYAVSSAPSLVQFDNHGLNGDLLTTQSQPTGAVDLMMRTKS